MSKKALIDFNSTSAAQFRELFGPPPVLKAEDEKNYEAILCGLARDVRPQNLIEQILVRDLADSVYETQWLRRLRNGVVKQAHKDKLQQRRYEVAAAAELRKRSLRGGTEPASFFTEVNQKAGGLDADKHAPEAKAIDAEIGKIDAEAQEMLAELEKAEHGPVDEAALFQSWIGPYEQVERRLAAAMEQFRTTLEQLDEHRRGLGQRLRQVVDEIVDVEYEEDPAPLVQPGVTSKELEASSTALVKPGTSSTAKPLDGPVEPGTSSMKIMLLAPSAEPAVQFRETRVSKEDSPAAIEPASGPTKDSATSVTSMETAHPAAESPNAPLKPGISSVEIMMPMMSTGSAVQLQEALDPGESSTAMPKLTVPAAAAAARRRNSSADWTAVPSAEAWVNTRGLAAILGAFPMDIDPSQYLLVGLETAVCGTPVD